MSTLNVPNSGNNVFTVINATTIEYLGVTYTGVTDIAYPDGTHKTPSDLLAAAGGGQTLSAGNVKPCVRVEAYNPDDSNRQVFLAYSSNSKQTAKNNDTQIEGGLTVDMVNFLGSGSGTSANPVLVLWKNYFDSIGADYTAFYNPTWLGFKINYGISESRSYVMTQLNDFLEESVPSPPTNIGTTVMHNVRLQGAFHLPPRIGNAEYVPLNRFRLYRAAITTDGNFVYEHVNVKTVQRKFGLNNPILVGGIDPGTGEPWTLPRVLYEAVLLGYAGYVDGTFGYEFIDDQLTQDLLEPLPSLDWDAPPPRKLKGLTAWRNGIMAAYTENHLYLCEPYRPFTFPQKYIRSLPWNIVGMRVDENVLVVVTEGEPYIFTGSHPSQVAYERLQGVQAGIKPFPVAGGVNPTRAIVRTPKGVIYASKEGAILIQGGRAGPIWRELFTREEWMQRYAAGFGAMHMAYFDGRVLVYFEPPL